MMYENENKVSDAGYAYFDKFIATTKADARCYQRRICAKVLDRFAPEMMGEKRHQLHTLLVNSATGSGKSIIGLAVAAMMQKLDEESGRKLSGGEGLGVAFVAMRRNLLNQIVRDLDRMGLQVKDLTVISMFDKNPPTHDASGRRLTFIIADEAHHDAAGSMSFIYEQLKPKWVLGLSATPFRLDKAKLCFQGTIKDAGIKELMELGYLAQYHKYVIPKWNPETVTERYIAEPERWGRSAMYWRTTEEADECLSRLLAAGVKAEMVTGTMPMDEREKVLARFTAGTTKVLVNLFVLTEGWSCDELQTVWVRDSSRGPTIQMVGRVLRLCKTVGTKQVVQSENTKYPFERVTRPYEKFVWSNDDWHHVGRNCKIEQTVMDTRHALAMSEPTVIPDFIKKAKANKFQRRLKNRQALDFM